MGNNGNNANNGVSTKTQKVGPTGLLLELILFKQGVDSQLVKGSSYTVAGQDMTQQSMSLELGSDIALFQAVIDAVRALKVARQARQLSAAEERIRFQAMRAAIKAIFGHDSPVLEQFGISPRKAPVVLTAEQKAVRAAKGKLTRKARHTQSRKQKQAIKTVGTPTLTIAPDGTSITPPTDPTASGTK